MLSIPGEVRKSFSMARCKLPFPLPRALITLAGTRLRAVGFNLESAWMVQRKEGVPAPDDEYVVQIIWCCHHAQWGQRRQHCKE